MKLRRSKMMKFQSVINFNNYNDFILEILNSIDDLTGDEAICKKFLERICFHFDIEKSGIYLNDPDKQEFYYIASAGVDRENIELKRVSVYETGFSILFNVKTEIIFPEISDDELEDFKFLKDMERAIIFPLTLEDEVLGFLFVARRGEQFTDIEINKLKLLFNNIAPLINQQILYKKLLVSQGRLTEAYDNLQTLDRMKTAFLNNLTHELRTPLVTIKGYTELLRYGDFGKLNDSQKSAIEVVYKNANKLGDLIDNLLTFVSLSDKLSSKNFVKFNLVKFVSRLINEYEETNVTILFSTDIEKAIIYGDKYLLEIALKQLLSNALKFNKNNNPEVIQIEALKDKKTQKKKVVLKIIDKGIGISEKKLNRIFDEFSRITGEMDYSYSGIGFGLSITKKILDFHNFEFFINSTVDKGTEVGFKADITED